MRNLFLVGIGLLMGVALCELGLRLAGVSYPIFSKIDGDLGMVLRPDVLEDSRPALRPPSSRGAAWQLPGQESCLL